MDPLILSLRFVHIVFGALWVGMMAFTVFVLTPAFREVGPDGAKVAAALQRRRLMTVLPIMALLTLASGFWLVERLYGGMARLTASRMGMAITIGAGASLVAFLVGIVVMRPAMMRATTTTDQAEAQRLRARGAVAGQVVAVLLIIALATMAIARYL